METIQAEKLDEDIHISSKQKGAITENRVAEIVTLSSRGQLTCYTPNSDDDGIDLIVNLKGDIQPIFIQVKGRFKLQKNGAYIQNVGLNTFTSNHRFYLLFVYFNKNNLEVEKLWLVPSYEFASLAHKQKEGDTYKSFFRFTANPKSTKDKWSRYSVDKADLGDKLMEIIRALF